MGVLNVTPDSFFDKGRFFDKKKAVHRALEMERDGADIIDIGGESTRPGSAGVSAAEELKRVLPVIEAVVAKAGIPVSIDTRKSEVAKEALKAGASVINDVSGLRHDRGMADVAAKYGAGLIVMHMKGTPRDMQENPSYGDLIGEITGSLRESIETAKRAGVAEGDIIIDPGIGFGKTVEHNLIILNRLGEFKSLKRPICIGVSRKSFIGKLLGDAPPDARLSGTLAACAIAIMKGADILRVHDVKEAKEAATVADGILREKWQN
jgi:dihydropteroate synthase